MRKYERLPPGVLARLPSVRDLLEREDNVVFAYLFGGLARGAPGPLSDVDIAVSLSDPQRPAEYKLSLFDRITDLLGTGEVDLVILETSPVSLAGRILQDREVLVDKDPPRRHLYESLTLRKFFDFRVREERLLKERYGLGR